MCKRIALRPASGSFFFRVILLLAGLLSFFPFLQASVSFASYCSTDNISSSACNAMADPGIAALSHTNYRHIANPVDVVTGAKQQRDIDFQAVGSPLHFSRYYHSGQANTTTSLGRGWRHSYMVRLFSGGNDQWRIQQADGRWIHFMRDNQSLDVTRFRAPLDSDGYLVIDGKTRWIQPDGREMFFQGSFLTAIKYPHDIHLKLFYKNRKLLSVTDEHGQTIRFEYTAGREGLADYNQARAGQLKGFLRSLTLPSGQRVKFHYDSDGRLLRADYPDEHKINYAYENREHPSHVTSISRSSLAGDDVRRWLYDDTGRVIQFEHPSRQIKLAIDYEFMGADAVVNETDQASASVTLVQFEHGRQEFYSWQHQPETDEPAVFEVTAKVCSECALVRMHPRSPLIDELPFLQGRDQSKSDEQESVSSPKDVDAGDAPLEGLPGFDQLVPSPFTLDKRADVLIGGETFSIHIHVSRLGEVADISVGSTSLSELKNKWGQGLMERCDSQPLLRRSKIFPTPQTGCIEDLIYLVELSRHLERLSRDHGLKKNKPMPRSRTADKSSSYCLMNPFESCESLERDFQFAQLSSCAYLELLTKCTDQWQTVKPASLGLADSAFRHDEFSATLFYNPQEDSYVVAFRGTDNIGDWKDNLIQAGGEVTSQYRRAVSLARAVKGALPKASVSFTGHSLGGGLATAAALSVDGPATVFNPAALHPGTATAMGLDYHKADKLVNVTTVDGDLLTELQGPADAKPTVLNNSGHDVDNTRFAAPGKHTMIAAPESGWVDAEKKQYPLLARFDSLVLHSMNAVLKAEENLLIDFCGKTPSSA